MQKPCRALRRAAVISPLVLFVLISLAFAQKITSNSNQQEGKQGSDRTVTISLTMPDNRVIIISELDGEMSRTGPKGGDMLGITPIILDNGTVKLYFSSVTKITKKNRVVGEKITNIGDMELVDTRPQTAPISHIASIHLISITREATESRIRINSMPRCPCCLTCDGIETCGSGVIVPGCGSCMCSN